MNITKKIKVDLQNPGSTPIIHAVQTDSNVRNLEIELFNDHKAFRIPKDAQVIIRYRNFDGSGGEYDTLPDDTPAWHIQKNTLYLTLVPQVLSLPGSVSITVTLISAGQQITVFPIQLNVDGIAAAAIAKAENYFYVTGFLPAPKQAEVGQYLCVSDVNSAGKVTAVNAVHVSPGAGEEINESTVHAIVEAYLAENPPVTTESDPTVPDWAKQPQKPAYTAQEVGAQPAGDYLLKTELPDIISDTLAQAQESGKFDGEDGDPGKSAYAYAQEGGYRGSEEDFSSKLAEDIPAALPNPNALTINGTAYDGAKAVEIDTSAFVITVTGNQEAGYTPDKTGAEIQAAYADGKRIVCSITNIDSFSNIPLVYRRAYRIAESTPVIKYVYHFRYTEGESYKEVTIQISPNTSSKIIGINVNSGTYALKSELESITSKPSDAVLYVHLTPIEGTEFSEDQVIGYEAIPDVDLLQAYQAIVDGKAVFVATPEGYVCQFIAAVDEGMLFGASITLGADVIQCAVTFGIDSVSVLFTLESSDFPTLQQLTINSYHYDGSEPMDYTDIINSMIDEKINNLTAGDIGALPETTLIPTVPDSLPSPAKLAVNGVTYDGSADVDITETINTMVDAKLNPQTELVLSDNLFDKSAAVMGSNWYHSSSGPSLTTAQDSFYAFVPLWGAGTYRTILWWAHHGESYAKRVPILKADNSFLQNVTGTLTKIDNTFGYLEFTITEEMIANGAAVYAYGGFISSLDTLMIVKDREYPSEYIPYGYIEVEVEGGSKAGAANILRGKTAVFLGDSICAGTTVGDNSEYYGYGWAGLIGESNAMTWKNYGRNGATITPLNSVDTARWMSAQADSALAAYPNADYVIFEGGCNDADIMQDALLGEISSDYATFNESTFSGGFESLVLKLLTNFPTAKIGYVIPQKMNAVNNHSTAGHVHRRFFDRAIEICEKWGIPYIDLWKCNPLNPKLSTASRFYTDGQHLTIEGYHRITPQIEAFMRRL